MSRQSRITILASAFVFLGALGACAADEKAAPAPDKGQMEAKCADMMAEKGKGMMQEKSKAGMKGCGMMAKKKSAAAQANPGTEDHSEHHPKP